MRWIGICGRAAAGKDHLYEALVRVTGWTAWYRIAFADMLKRDIETALMPDHWQGHRHLEPLWNKPYSPEIRALLQWWGTELRRAENVRYWMGQGEMAAIMADEGYGDYPVFTDVRFPNEADMIRRNGGIIVRVFADPATRAARLGGELPPEHQSELAMAGYENIDWIMPSRIEGEAYDADVRHVLELAGPENA